MSVSFLGALGTMTSAFWRLGLILAILALVAIACGDDDNDSSEGSGQAEDDSDDDAADDDDDDDDFSPPFCDVDEVAITSLLEEIELEHLAILKCLDNQRHLCISILQRNP